MNEKPKIGISACLVGRKVRYDGTSKMDPELIAALEPRVELVPVCPEAEMGLGVPREPMHLEGDPAAPRLVTNETHIDRTVAMNEWARERVQELAGAGLRGFILKSRSPSCGLGSVEIWSVSETGEPQDAPGAFACGLFARTLRQSGQALLIVEDESLSKAESLAAFLKNILER